MIGETLLQDLRHFTGSESIFYYKPFGQKISIPDKEYGRVFLTYSEGMQYLFKEGHCYWLLDQIFAKYAKVLQDNRCRGLTVWTLTKRDSGAQLSAAYDSGVASTVSVDIEYTDFKAFENDSFKFYAGLTQCGDDVVYNLFLTSEY